MPLSRPGGTGGTPQPQGPGRKGPLQNPQRSPPPRGGTAGILGESQQPQNPGMMSHPPPTLLKSHPPLGGTVGTLGGSPQPLNPGGRGLPQTPMTSPPLGGTVGTLGMPPPLSPGRCSLGMSSPPPPGRSSPPPGPGGTTGTREMAPPHLVHPGEGPTHPPVTPGGRGGPLPGPKVSTMGVTVYCEQEIHLCGGHLMHDDTHGGKLKNLI